MWTISPCIIMNEGFRKDTEEQDDRYFRWPVSKRIGAITFTQIERLFLNIDPEELKHFIVVPQTSEFEGGYEYIDVNNVSDTLRNYLFSEAIRSALGAPIEKWLEARRNIIDRFCGARLNNQDFWLLQEKTFIIPYLNAYYELLVSVLSMSRNENSDDLFFGSGLSLCDILLNADSMFVSQARNQIEYLPISPLYLASTFAPLCYLEFHCRQYQAITPVDHILSNVYFDEFGSHRRVLGDKLYLVKRSDDKIVAIDENGAYSRVEIPAIRLLEKIRDVVQELQGKSDVIRIAIIGDVYLNSLVDLLSQLQRENLVCGPQRVLFTVYSSVLKEEYRAAENRNDQVSNIHAYKEILTIKQNMQLAFNENIRALFYQENGDSSNLKYNAYFFLDNMGFYKSGKTTSMTDDHDSYVKHLKAKHPLITKKGCRTESDLRMSVNYFGCVQKRLSAVVGQRVMERNIYSKSFNIDLYNKICKIIENANNQDKNQSYYVYLFISKQEALESVGLNNSNICRSERYDGREVAGMMIGCAARPTLEKKSREIQKQAHKQLSIDEPCLAITISLWQLMKYISSNSYVDIFKRLEKSRKGECANVEMEDFSLSIEVMRNILLQIDYSKIGARNSSVSVDVALHLSASEYVQHLVEKNSSLLCELIETVLKNTFLDPANVLEKSKDACAQAVSGALYGRGTKISDLLFSHMISKKSTRKSITESLLKNTNGLDIQNHFDWDKNSPIRKWMSTYFDMATEQAEDKRYYSYLIEMGDAAMMSLYNETYSQLLLEQQSYLGDYEVKLRRKRDKEALAYACELMGYTDSYLYLNVKS